MDVALSHEPLKATLLEDKLRRGLGYVVDCSRATSVLRYAIPSPRCASSKTFTRWPSENLCAIVSSSMVMRGRVAQVFAVRAHLPAEINGCWPSQPLSPTVPPFETTCSP